MGRERKCRSGEGIERVIPGGIRFFFQGKFDRYECGTQYVADVPVPMQRRLLASLGTLSKKALLAILVMDRSSE